MGVGKEECRVRFACAWCSDVLGSSGDVDVNVFFFISVVVFFVYVWDRVGI